MKGTFFFSKISLSLKFSNSLKLKGDSFLEFLSKMGKFRKSFHFEKLLKKSLEFQRWWIPPDFQGNQILSHFRTRYYFFCQKKSLSSVFFWWEFQFLKKKTEKSLKNFLPKYFINRGEDFVGKSDSQIRKFWGEKLEKIRTEFSKDRNIYISRFFLLKNHVDKFLIIWITCPQKIKFFH